MQRNDYITIKDKPFEIDTITGEIVHLPLSTKPEDENPCNPLNTYNGSPTLDTNTKSASVSVPVYDNPLHTTTCNNTLKALYKSRQYYPLKYSINNFSTLFKGNKAMYQEQTLKICQHIECMNIAFLNKQSLIDILQVSDKNLTRTLDRMIDRDLLKHYRYLTNDKVYSIVVNPCLFFKGDYNLRAALIRMHLRDTTRLTDYRVLQLPVDNVNCKNSNDSSDAVKDLYKVWCKNKSQDSFDAYLQAIKKDSKRECFNTPIKPYKQDYKQARTIEAIHCKDHPLSFVKMDDLSFRLKFII